MIARIAREMETIPGWAPMNLSESQRRMLASTALKAMREPRAAMIEAARKMIDDDEWIGPEDLWRAMINAALNEREKGA
jgi:hypothetical protein